MAGFIASKFDEIDLVYAELICSAAGSDACN